MSQVHAFIAVVFTENHADRLASLNFTFTTGIVTITEEPITIRTTGYSGSFELEIIDEDYLIDHPDQINLIDVGALTGLLDKPAP